MLWAMGSCIRGHRTGAGRLSGVSYAMRRSQGLVILLKGFKLECNRIRLMPLNFPLAAVWRGDVWTEEG